jgi:hypothetical protein
MFSLAKLLKFRQEIVIKYKNVGLEKLRSVVYSIQDKFPGVSTHNVIITHACNCLHWKSRGSICPTFDNLRQI